jgi:hypothetical protein
VAPKPKTYVSPLGASERVLADGRVAVPGMAIALDGDQQKDEHNKRLIDSGQLLQTKDKPATEGGES